MGAGGVPNRTIERIDGKRGDLPTRAIKPNSRYDLYVNGKKIQSRWFDANGKVIRNRDYDHQDSHHNHEFPHDHNWKWTDAIPCRNPENLKPDYEKYF